MDPFKAMLMEITTNKLISAYYHSGANEIQQAQIMHEVDKLKEHDAPFHAELLRHLADADPCKDKIKENAAEAEAQKAMDKMMGKV